MYPYQYTTAPSPKISVYGASWRFRFLRSSTSSPKFAFDSIHVIF